MAKALRLDTGQSFSAGFNIGAEVKITREGGAVENKITTFDSSGNPAVIDRVDANLILVNGQAIFSAGAQVLEIDNA